MEAIEESKVGNIMNDGKNALKEKDAIAAWKALNDFYAKNTASNRVIYLLELMLAMIQAASFGETTNLTKCIEQTHKAKGKLEKIQSTYPDELYISALMMCSNLVNPNWKDQLESEIRRQEEIGESYSL